MVEAGDAAEQRNILAGAQVAAPDAAVTQERGQQGVDRVDRNREAQPLTAGDDRGVDAYDSAGARDERSAGIAGIERRVGLDDMLDQASRPGAERPASR